MRCDENYKWAIDINPSWYNDRLADQQSIKFSSHHFIDGLMQEMHSSIANALDTYF